MMTPFPETPDGVRGGETVNTAGGDPGAATKEGGGLPQEAQMAIKNRPHPGANRITCQFKISCDAILDYN